MKKNLRSFTSKFYRDPRLETKNGPSSWWLLGSRGCSASKTMLLRRGKHLSLAENFGFLDAPDFARCCPRAVRSGWRAAGCSARCARRPAASVVLFVVLRETAHFAADHS